MTKISRFVAAMLATSVFATAAIAAYARPFNVDLTPPDPHYMLYEDWLSQEVHNQLVLLPFYSVFDNLAFKVDGGRVTLLGQVVKPTLKSDAAAAVKSIEGVSAVDNQIEVLPVSPSDDQIRLAEYRAIYSAPGMEKYAMQAVPPIHIIVKNGHVTLVGVVANAADKTLADVRAKSVPGVFSVTDQLTVEK